MSIEPEPDTFQHNGLANGLQSKEREGEKGPENILQKIGSLSFNLNEIIMCIIRE